MFLLEDYQILLTGVRLSNSTGVSAVLVMKHLILKQTQSALWQGPGFLPCQG